MNGNGIEFDVGRLYLDLPLVDGQPMTDQRQLAAVADLPRLHWILQKTAPTKLGLDRVAAKTPKKRPSSETHAAAER